MHEAFAQADVILAAGCRFSSWMWDERGPLARRHHRLINVNIDPAALGAPALHEVALHADADLALADLQAALGNAGDLAVDADWLPRLRELRAQYEHKLGEMALSAGAGDASGGAGARHRGGAAARCARRSMTAVTPRSGATT